MNGDDDLDRRTRSMNMTPGGRRGPSGALRSQWLRGFIFKGIIHERTFVTKDEKLRAPVQAGTGGHAGGVRSRRFSQEVHKK